jgi:hypothetical protein
MFSSTAGWLLLVVTDEGTAATRTRADSGQTLGTGVGTRAGLPVDVRNHKRGAFARAGWLRRPTPPLVVKPGGAASLQLIFRRRAGSPWSWHQFGRVGPDGCPGFKGPFPQPVSMSGAKFRCDSGLAQGTAGETARKHAEPMRQSLPRRRRLRSRSAPKTVRAMDGAAGAPREGFTAFFGALLDRGGLAALLDFTPVASRRLPCSCARRSNVLT